MSDDRASKDCLSIINVDEISNKLSESLSLSGFTTQPRKLDGIK